MTMDWRGSSPGYITESSDLFLFVETIRLGFSEDLSIWGTCERVKNVHFLCESLN